MSTMTEMSIPSLGRPSQDASMTNELDGFAARLRLAREERGFSQGELSRRAGVRPETVSRYESGQLPRVSELVAIATALDRSIDWLLCDDGADEQADDITWTIEQEGLDVVAAYKLRAVRRAVGPMSRSEMLTTAERIKANAAAREANAPLTERPRHLRASR